MRAGFSVSKLEGASGEVWIGKATRAAALSTWMAVPCEGSAAWEFSGQVTERDEYLMTQGPDTVRLAFGPTKELRWTGPLEIAGDRVRCTFVGPPEER